MTKFHYFAKHAPKLILNDDVTILNWACVYFGETAKKWEWGKIISTTNHGIVQLEHLDTRTIRYDEKLKPFGGRDLIVEKLCMDYNGIKLLAYKFKEFYWNFDVIYIKNSRVED